jgi:hypothetical protein
MAAAISIPLAFDPANDNARATSARRGEPGPRARTALAAPLHEGRAVPVPACRRWHTVHGARILSSVVAVDGRASCWRVSVTIWGRPNAERRAIAELLARRLIDGIGTGPVDVERGPCVLVLRRALAFEERGRLPARRISR